MRLNLRRVSFMIGQLRRGYRPRIKWEPPPPRLLPMFERMVDIAEDKGKVVKAIRVSYWDRDAYYDECINHKRYINTIMMPKGQMAHVFEHPDGRTYPIIVDGRIATGHPFVQYTEDAI